MPLSRAGVQGGRLAEHEALDGWRAGRGRGAGRAGGWISAARPVRASSRARWMPTQTCGPWAKARWRRASGGARSKRSGSGRRRRVAVGGGDRDADEVAARDLRAAELGVARWRSGRRPPRRARAAATPRSPRRAAPGRRGPARAASGCSSRCRSRVGDHPLGRLDPAEQQDGGVRDDLARREIGRRRRGASSDARAVGEHGARGARAARRRRRAPRGHGLGPAVTLGDRGDDRVVPAEHRADLAPARARARAATIDAASGPGEGAPQLGAGRRRRAPSIRRSASRLDAAREALAHRGAAERRRRTARGGGRAPRRRGSACSARRPARSRSAGRRR